MLCWLCVTHSIRAFPSLPPFVNGRTKLTNQLIDRSINQSETPKLRTSSSSSSSRRSSSRRRAAVARAPEGSGAGRPQPRGSSKPAARTGTGRRARRPRQEQQRRRRRAAARRPRSSRSRRTATLSAVPWRRRRRAAQSSSRAPSRAPCACGGSPTAPPRTTSWCVSSLGSYCFRYPLSTHSTLFRPIPLCTHIH